MTESISRSGFLRGRFRDRGEPARPPWARAEAGFRAACTGCDDCIRACPETILVKGRDGLPRLSFDVGACTFCGDCVAACPTDALIMAPGDRPFAPPVSWTFVALVDDACLAPRGLACRICGAQCARGAIRFPVVIGGTAAPVIDTAGCTGCGACVAPCPTDAIRIAEDRAMTKEPAS